MLLILLIVLIVLALGWNAGPWGPNVGPFGWFVPLILIIVLLWILFGGRDDGDEDLRRVAGFARVVGGVLDRILLR